MTKQIEQVGWGYENLKERYANLREKIENGASATFSDSEDDVESENHEESKRARANSKDDYEKKRHRKTRENIE